MYKKGRIKLVYSFDYIYICGNVSLYKPKGQRKRSILCEFRQLIVYLYLR